MGLVKDNFKSFKYDGKQGLFCTIVKDKTETPDCANAFEGILRNISLTEGKYGITAKFLFRGNDDEDLEILYMNGSYFLLRVFDKLASYEEPLKGKKVLIRASRVSVGKDDYMYFPRVIVNGLFLKGFLTKEQYKKINSKDKLNKAIEKLYNEYIRPKLTVVPIKIEEEENIDETPEPVTQEIESDENNSNVEASVVTDSDVENTPVEDDASINSELDAIFDIALDEKNTEENASEEDIDDLPF